MGRDEIIPRERAIPSGRFSAVSAPDTTRPYNSPADRLWQDGLLHTPRYVAGLSCGRCAHLYDRASFVPTVALF